MDANSGGLVDRLMHLLRLDADDGLPMDRNLQAYLAVEESKRNQPLSVEQLEADQLSIDAGAASLADIPYDDVLTQALQAYKSGEIETFRGKAMGRCRPKTWK